MTGIFFYINLKMEVSFKHQIQLMANVKIKLVIEQEGPEALNRSPEYTGQKSNI